MKISKHLSQNPQEAYKKMKEAGEKLARYDESRPEYHFHAPGQWMDDPNGSIYFNGYYHIMYGANPDSDRNRGGMPYKTDLAQWDPEEPDWMEALDVWGHARSRDLVHWEHLPISLFPNPKKDEYFIWWGFTKINREGVPTIIYTSIGYQKRPADSSEQYIAYGDSDLITWRQADELNPILTGRIHGEKKYYEWRDPYIFDYGDSTYMILGASDCLEGQGRGLVLLYEALSPDYSQWKFKGELFEYPAPLRSIECPNLVRFGDKWVLFVSPHGPVEYFVGSLEPQKCRFVWERRGVLNPSTNFYATNLVFDDRGRCILFGALEGFENTCGWNGAAALPRIVNLNFQGELTQVPAPEIRKLRALEHEWCKERQIFHKTGTFETEITFETGDWGAVTFTYGEESFTVWFGDSGILAGNYRLDLKSGAGIQKIKVFFDKSVMELFVDDNQSIAVLIPVCTGNCCVDGKSEKETLKIRSWDYDTASLFTYYDEKEKV